MKYYYAYIVQCSDGTLYTGYSTDVKKRVKTHNKGKGAKYTRSRLPCVLVWESQPWGDKASAMTHERIIKAKSRASKIRMIKERPSTTGPINHSMHLVEDDFRPSDEHPSGLSGEHSEVLDAIQE